MLFLSVVSVFACSAAEPFLRYGSLCVRSGHKRVIGADWIVLRHDEPGLAQSAANPVVTLGRRRRCPKIASFAQITPVMATSAISHLYAGADFPPILRGWKLCCCPFLEHMATCESSSGTHNAVKTRSIVVIVRVDKNRSDSTTTGQSD